MRQIKVTFLAIALACIFTAAPASATSSKATKIQSSRDWTAYSFSEGSSRVCYIASQPTKEKGDYKRRGDVFVFVTHRPAISEYNVVSFLAGYDYKDQSDVTVTVDGDKKFTLFAEKDRAWAPDAETDQTLVNAMKAGKTMVVKGMSSRGTMTTDTYSLFGFTASLKAIDQRCKN